MNRPFQVPAHSERLFDLVRPSKGEYRSAFYYAMRDTLVCADLPTANQIGYGKPRRRVVTLAGELIDVSGTISGGGKAAISGGMKTANFSSEEMLSEGEIEKLEQEIQIENQQLQQLILEVILGT